MALFTIRNVDDELRMRLRRRAAAHERSMEEEVRQILHAAPQDAQAGKRSDAFEAALAALFDQDFAGRVLPFDRAAVRLYSAIVERRRRTGRPIAQFDAQVAAIAASRRARIATRDASAFEDCGIDVVDPWSAGG